MDIGTVWLSNRTEQSMLELSSAAVPPPAFLAIGGSLGVAAAAASCFPSVIWLFKAIWFVGRYAPVCVALASLVSPSDFRLFFSSISSFARSFHSFFFSAWIRRGLGRGRSEIERCITIPPGVTGRARSDLLCFAPIRPGSATVGLRRAGTTALCLIFNLRPAHTSRLVYCDLEALEPRLGIRNERHKSMDESHRISITVCGDGGCGMLLRESRANEIVN